MSAISYHEYSGPEVLQVDEIEKPPSGERSLTMFGTRSSSLITISDNGTVCDRFADGPPCKTDYDAINIPFECNLSYIILVFV